MKILSYVSFKTRSFINNKQYDLAAIELNKSYKFYGDLNAYHRLGELYLKKHIPCNNYLRTAVKIFVHCANKGSLPSQITLGDIFSQGKHCERDFSRARKWYLKAARQNSYYAAVQASAIWGDEEVRLIISRHKSHF